MSKKSCESMVNYALGLHAQSNNAMIEAIECLVNENGSIEYTHQDGFPCIKRIVKKDDELGDYMIYEGGVDICALEDSTSDDFYNMLTTYKVPTSD